MFWDWGVRVHSLVGFCLTMGFDFKLGDLFMIRIEVSDLNICFIVLNSFNYVELKVIVVNKTFE